MLDTSQSLRSQLKLFASLNMLPTVVTCEVSQPVGWSGIFCHATSALYLARHRILLRTWKNPRQYDSFELPFIHLLA